MTEGAVRPRVLFVDDEPAILTSLRKVLNRDRARWDMVFANSGHDALAELAKAPFDVVVTDMRMPGMDGAELLARIVEGDPAVVRIMLTGHADRESLSRALPGLHQLLSKPCNAARLRDAIERGVELPGRGNPLRRVLGSFTRLPSPPRLYFELTELVQDRRASVGSVAALIERDPSSCAKLLQLVNSAYFGDGETTTSIDRAVARLGTDELRYLVLSASVFRSLADERLPGLSLDEMQVKALQVARCARTSLPGPRGDDAYAAGVLHELGRLVLSLGLPDAYAEVARRVAAGEDLCTTERELIGVDHAETGAYLLRLWGLPDRIVEPVRFHHRPDEAPESSRDVAAALHQATTAT